MSLKMKFLGGAGQVEGSALLLQSKNSNFLLDQFLIYNQKFHYLKRAL